MAATAFRKYQHFGVDSSDTGKKKVLAPRDDLNVSLVTEECLSESTSVIDQLREENARLIAENAKLKAAHLLALAAFTFRQLTCSYVANKFLSHVRYLSLQMLELYVHDEQIYQGTEAEAVNKRWKDICDLFAWSNKWDTDDQIPAVVKYIDDKAKDAPLLYSIDIDDVRECLKETRDQLKHLSKDDCSLILLDMVDKMMDPLDQLNELPDTYCHMILKKE